MTQPTTPANDIEAVRRHHKMHGDMDGNTCLLSECALHYPQPTTYTCQAIKSDDKPCNYTWTPRPKRFEQGRSKPVQCPHCQSKDWDKKGD